MERLRDLMRGGIQVMRAPPAFLKDLGLLGLGQIGGRLIGFLTFAYLARVLDVSGYGMLETVIALTAFAGLVVDFGAGPVGVTAFHRGKRDIAGVIPVLRLMVAAVIVPVLMIGLWFVAGAEIAALGIIYAATLLILAFKADWLQQAIERMDLVAFGQVLRAGVLALGVLVLVSGPGDLGLVAVAEVMAVLVFVGYFLFLQNRSGVSFRLSPTGLPALARKAAPLCGGNLIWGVLYILPPVIVAAIAGPVEAAFFAAALRLVVAVQSFSQIYHFNLFASLARRGTGAEMTALSSASFRLIAWVMLGPAAIAAVYSEAIMGTVFGGPYREGGLVLALLIFAVPLQFLAGHHRWALTAAEENGAVLKASIGGAITACISLPLLTYALGGVGAGLAVLISALVVWVVSDKEAAARGLDLPSPLSIAIPLGCAAAAGGLTYVLPIQPFIAAPLTLVLYGGTALCVDRRIPDDFRTLANARSGVAER